MSLPLALFTLIALNAAPALPEGMTQIPFPGSGPAFTDYVALDTARHTLWVPAGSRGETYVLDLRTQKFETIGGFATRQMGKHVAGPTSVTVAQHAVYVGNRADSSVCGFVPSTLARGTCVTLPSMPDGVAYVGATHELWSTTPRDSSLTIVKIASDGAMKVSGQLHLDGSPEGYAVDDAHGLFFTNDEDKDATLAIDVRTRKIVATYQPKCGKEGPRGLVLDAAHQRLFVACASGAVVLDLAHQGRELGRVRTGAGVDTIDLSPRGELLLASGRTGQLILAKISDSGALTVEHTVPTSDGVRCVAVDPSGRAYLPDSKNARLIVWTPPASK